MAWGQQGDRHDIGTAQMPSDPLTKFPVIRMPWFVLPVVLDGLSSLEW